jgi:hypothetical protein
MSGSRKYFILSVFGFLSLVKAMKHEKKTMKNYEKERKNNEK